MGLLFAVAAVPAFAQSWPGQPQRMTNYPQTYYPQTYVQATLGELDVRSQAGNSLDTPVTPPTNEVQTFGFVMQMATDKNFFQYGFEAGDQVGLDRRHDLFAHFNGEYGELRLDEPGVQFTIGYHF